MSHESVDTRATAYVFGELSADDSADFERELAQSSKLRDEVAAIGEAVAAISAEFEGETTGVNESNRKQIEQAIVVASSSASESSAENQVVVGNAAARRRIWIVAAMAASVLIVLGLGYHFRGNDVDTVTQISDSPEPARKSAVVTGKGGGIATKGGPDVAMKTSISGSYEPANMPMTELADADEPQSDESHDLAQVAAAPIQLSKETAEAARDRNKPTAPSPFAPAPTAASEKSAVKALGSTDLQSSAALQQKRRAVTPAPTAPESLPKQFKKLQQNESQVTRSQGKQAGYGRDASAGTLSGGMGMPKDTTDLRVGGVANVEAKSINEMLSLLEAAPTLGNAPAAGGEMRGRGERQLFGDSSPEPGGIGGGIGPDSSGDKHEPISDNPFMDVKNEALSTFSVDVDTAAYAKVRMYLMQHNQMPRPDAVRIEELVNYFPYDYAPPKDDRPFAATMDITECPWNPKHRLARIGIKGRVIEDERPASNLVFLLDVSGSMNQPNKLPLVVEGMKMLTGQLTENDSVAIVVYAGAAGLVLESTSGDQKQVITSALDRLRAGGSTNGGAGITLAYQIARDNFIVGGTNRVILCTDGDFNVGVTGDGSLVRLAEENAKSNIYLSMLGFGMGNHNDSMMEQVSNKGNGNYAFIDGESEARKVLVEEMGSTLVTIAKDVKIQVEFNPKEVKSYRLIGYENRIMAAQDFNDDTKDAGEIGAGHTVTALYELVPAGVESDVTVPPVDDLRYQRKAKLSKEANSGEMLTLKLRYKAPDAKPNAESTLIEFPVSDSGKDFSEMDEDFQFAAGVAAFGMLLRNSPYKGDATFAAVEEIVSAGAEDDSSGYRAEFLEMVSRAKTIRGE